MEAVNDNPARSLLARYSYTTRGHGQAIQDANRSDTMRVILPVERTAIDTSRDVDFGDVLIHTTVVLILGQTETEDGETVGVGRFLGSDVKGIRVVEELNKPLPDLSNPEDVNPEEDPELQVSLDNKIGSGTADES
jgi:hypothetical protein